jgi:PemK-like, MazF-like toxin of type II toxin-antitoxin system
VTAPGPTLPGVARLLSSITRAARRLGGRSPAGGQARRGGGAQVVYAPERDGDPDPGEVVWAWVPYEDDARQGKDRPVLVVGYEGGGGRLLAVPLSSKDPEHKRDADEWVSVGTGGWDREQRESFANADRLLRYDPGDVRREGAALPRARFDAVVAEARRLGRLP